MFTVDLNEETNAIQVKTDKEGNSTTIAVGTFAVDEPDHMTLILFKHIQIAPNDHQELDQFLSTVISYVGKFYKSAICLRLPSVFDNRIDLDKLELKNKLPMLMSVTLDYVKYYPENNLLDKQGQYELITNKEPMLNHAEELLKLMHKNAFWSNKWDLQEMRDRINSGTNNAMILDKINNVPCGFGRLFLLTTNDEIFGYLSDIAIDTSHQSKGLGRVIVNNLVGISVSQEMKQRGINGTLCLQCADEGSGAVSAPKLYNRSGFEFVNELGNRITIFGNKDNAFMRDE